MLILEWDSIIHFICLTLHIMELSQLLNNEIPMRVLKSSINFIVELITFMNDSSFKDSFTNFKNCYN